LLPKGLGVFDSRAKKKRAEQGRSKKSPLGKKKAISKKKKKGEQGQLFFLENKMTKNQR